MRATVADQFSAAEFESHARPRGAFESSERGAAHARAYMLGPVRREHARKARLGLARLRHAPGDPTKPRNYSITRLRRRSSNHQGRRDSDFRADYQPTRVAEGSPARSNPNSADFS